MTDGTGGSTTASFTVTVTQEDAAAVYVGDAIAFAGPGGSAASVLLLRATVRDSSIVASSGDAAPGDIRNATVTFRQGATTLCGPVPVQLLNGHDDDRRGESASPRSASASTPWTSSSAASTPGRAPRPRGC